MNSSGDFPDPTESTPRHLAIGVFDGVHLGHAAVIQSAIDAAGKDGGRPAVMTFDPHPTRIVAPGKEPLQLTSPDEKSSLVRKIGCPDIITIGFDKKVASLSPKQFVSIFCCGGKLLSSISVGSDWTFGHRRSGNIDTLRQLASEHGFRAQIIDPVSVDGIEVRSATIRRAISDRDLTRAKRLLGRSYSITGPVIAGKRLGRQLGFKTANLKPSKNRQLPPDGVYAVSVIRGGHQHFGVANLGLRPTLEGDTHERLLETHLFGLDPDQPDFYGEEITVAFDAFVRCEMKFGGLQDLRDQIAEDVDTTKRYFRSNLA